MEPRRGLRVHARAGGAEAPRRQRRVRPLEAAFTTDILLGLGLSQRASIGLAVPIAVIQGGSSGLPPTVHSAGQIPSTALGDMSLLAKATILPNENGGFGMALGTMFTLPTGDPGSFMGEGALTGQARLTADYSLVVANVQASVGYFFRTYERTWPEASAGGVTFGGKLPVVRLHRPQAGHRPRARSEGSAAMGAGVRGWLPLHPVAPFGGDGAAALSPRDALLRQSLRLRPEEGRDLLAGIDIGLSQAVGCPRFAASSPWVGAARSRPGQGRRRRQSR